MKVIHTLKMSVISFGVVGTWKDEEKHIHYKMRSALPSTYVGTLELKGARRDDPRTF